MPELKKAIKYSLFYRLFTKYTYGIVRTVILFNILVPKHAIIHKCHMRNITCIGTYT